MVFFRAEDWPTDRGMLVFTTQPRTLDAQPDLDLQLDRADAWSEPNPWVALAVGLGVPFVAEASGYGRLVSTVGWARRRLPLLNAVSGALLIGMGALFATNQGYYLAYHSASSQHLLGPLLR